MKSGINIKSMVIAALLCAVGIVIPLFSPKIVLEPASFTLASHVAIFLAMFISPSVAAAVTLGTSLGFFIAGFPIVVVLRAVSHIVFAFVGALWLKKQPEILSRFSSAAIFGIVVSVIHAICEIIIVTPFYFGNNMSSAYYAKGFVVSVLLLVGVGTVIHSLVDFIISKVIWKAITSALAK